MVLCVARTFLPHKASAQERFPLSKKPLARTAAPNGAARTRAAGRATHTRRKLC